MCWHELVMICSLIPFVEFIKVLNRFLYIRIINHKIGERFFTTYIYLIFQLKLILSKPHLRLLILFKHNVLNLKKLWYVLWCFYSIYQSFKMTFCMFGKFANTKRVFSNKTYISYMSNEAYPLQASFSVVVFSWTQRIDIKQ